MNLKKLTTIKTILLALILTISVNQLFAQTTNGIFFQAVARDNFSNPAKDRKIYVQSSIIQTTPTGTKVLTEEHQANTDATGVFSISLGNGVRVGGTATGLGTIDWSKGPFYLNLKVAITPIGSNGSWDYTKEWVDMGTTSFGAVPFALYSASSAKVDDKLNISDTTTMLKVYAKAMSVKTLETSLATKLTAADTLTMLAPYAKAAYTIDSNFFKTQLATKLSLKDSATKYVTPTQLAAKTFDQTPITNAIATKLNIADSSVYVTPTQLAAKTFDQTPITNAIASKLALADSTKYVTPTQLASYNFSSGSGGTTIDTSSLSNRINLKAPKESPSFTGVPSAPTAIAGVSTTQLATTAFVSNAVSNINAGSISGSIAIINGGTGATTQQAAINTLTGTQTSGKFLRSDGTNATLSNIQVADVPTLNQNTTGNAATVTTNANLTGDVTSVGNTSTVVKINGTSLSGLSTGILKNTTTTGMPSIAVAGTDYQAPIIVTTTGTGSATLSGTTLNIPNSSFTGGSISERLTIAESTGLPLEISSSSNWQTVFKLVNTSVPKAWEFGIGGSTNNSLGVGKFGIYESGGGYRFGITPGGNIQIGSTADAGYKLDVQGSTRVTGNLTTGDITFPTSHGSNGQVLSTTGSGTLGWTTPSSYSLTTADASTLGGIKVGTNLSIDGSGVLSVNINAGSISGTVAVANGGTGSTTKNFVDLTNVQTIAGNKIFSSDISVNGLTIGIGAGSMSNTVLGNSALSVNTTGTYNTAIGYTTLLANTIGTNNNAFGLKALLSNIDGSYNTATGGNTLMLNTSGWYNTAMGRRALSLNTTGNHNTAIGNKADVSTANLENATAIGDSAIVSASNTIQLGNTSVTNVKTSGTLTAGTVTYPNTHAATTGQVLTSLTSGTLTWTTPITTLTTTGTGAATLSGTTLNIPTPTAVRLTSDQITATAAQTSFTLAQTPLNAKVWMFINGVRTNNNAYSVIGTALTYVPSSNNSYAIVVGDRIQFDYTY